MRGLIWGQHICYVTRGKTQTSFRSDQQNLKLSSETDRVEGSEEMGDVKSQEAWLLRSGLVGGGREFSVRCQKGVSSSSPDMRRSVHE